MRFPDLAYELGLVEPSRKVKKQAIARLLHYHPRERAGRGFDHNGIPMNRQCFQADNLQRDVVDHALWAFSMESLAETCEMPLKDLTEGLGQPGPYSVRRFW